MVGAEELVNYVKGIATNLGKSLRRSNCIESLSKCGRIARICDTRCTIRRTSEKPCLAINQPVRQPANIESYNRDSVRKGFSANGAKRLMPERRQGAYIRIFE